MHYLLLDVCVRLWPVGYCVALCEGKSKLKAILFKLTCSLRKLLSHHGSVSIVTVLWVGMWENQDLTPDKGRIFLFTTASLLSIGNQGFLSWK